MSRDERISRFAAVICWNDNLQDPADDIHTLQLASSIPSDFVVFDFFVVACSLKTRNPVKMRFNDFQ